MHHFVAIIVAVVGKYIIVVAVNSPKRGRRFGEKSWPNRNGTERNWKIAFIPWCL